MGSLLTSSPADLAGLEARITTCRLCPRLVAWRERVALERRAAFAQETYWGRPVPGFGDPLARVYVLGLAPAAHGGNRTGRVFTGDRSGDFLIAAMHRTGFANQPTSRSIDDGLELHGAWIGAAEHEAALLPGLRVILCLGALAWDAALTLRGAAVARPKPRFGHGALLDDGAGLPLLGTFHPSQQNTFTGRLTPAMLDDVLLRARALAWAAG
jgi:uracil-DNA glycosylase